MAQKIAERLLVLKEHGGAVLERLYHIRQKMKSSDHKPMAFADDAPTGKLLAKLQKEYPKETFDVENVGIVDSVFFFVTQIVHISQKKIIVSK